jgi:hypothetical protein
LREDVSTSTWPEPGLGLWGKGGEREKGGGGGQRKRRGDEKKEKGRGDNCKENSFVAQANIALSHLNCFL